MNRPSPARGALHGLAAVTVASCVLAGCAPMLTTRAPAPMGPGQHDEFGLTGGVGVIDTSNGPLLPNGAAWFAHRFEHLELATMAFGSRTGIGAGFQIRYTRPFGALRLGFDLEGGVLWAGFGIPVALDLGDGLFVWTRPYVAPYGSGIGGTLPLGVSTVAGPLVLSAEVAVPYGFARTPDAMSDSFGDIHEVALGGITAALRY